MRLSCVLCTSVVFLAGGFPLRAADKIPCDLLVVGGNESAVAAAVQASRLGVKRVVLVNDIDWLGGQFSSEGVSREKVSGTFYGPDFDQADLLLRFFDGMDGITDHLEKRVRAVRQRQLRVVDSTLEVEVHSLRLQ
jgi:NADPH-dependent 2,4-dienoyl-CoA reductase/sulfur reductase-like enzyme